MKKVLIISIAFLVIIVVPLGYVLVLVYALKDNISVSAKLKAVDVTNLLQNKISLVLGLILDNKSPTAVKAKNIDVEIYYKGLKIASSKKGEDVKIIGKGKTEFDLPVDILLTKDLNELLKLFINKKPVPLKIKAKAKVYFIPVSFSTNYTYNP